MIANFQGGAFYEMAQFSDVGLLRADRLPGGHLTFPFLSASRFLTELLKQGAQRERRPGRRAAVGATAYPKIHWR